MTTTSHPAKAERPIANRLQPRWQGALAGAVGALIALAVAEVLGLILPDQPSLVLSVADRVIALTPANVREALVGAVGTSDKTLLAVGIPVVVVLIGLALGIRHRARPIGALSGFLLVGLVAAASGFTGMWSTAIIVVPALVGSFVGWAGYRWIVTGQGSARAAVGSPEVTPTAPGVSRRRVLAGAASVSLLAVAGGATVLAARRAAVAAVNVTRSALRIPKPTNPAPPVSAGASVPGIAPAVTTSTDFYRIDTALSPPTVDVASWSLRIEGQVGTPLTVTMDQMLAMPQTEAVVTLACVSNDVGGSLVGNAVWQGVLLSELFAMVKPNSSAEQVMAESVDGFTAGFPLSIALDGRPAMVAIAMNGQPLPVDHGFPARLVVPGVYGYVSATKWLRTIRLTTMAEEAGFWIQRGWSRDGSVEMASRIDKPKSGGSVTAGRLVVAGRAWHQHTGVGAVEIQVGAGEWQKATLADTMGSNAWRLWSWDWDATPGEYVLSVRMSDPDGKVQSSATHGVFPGASSGYHQIQVKVS